MAEILLRKEGQALNRSIQMLSNEMRSAMLENRLMPSACFQEQQDIACEWGTLLPILIAKCDGMQDVYQVYGANAQDRLLLCELLDTNPMEIKLFFQPSPLQGLPDCLVESAYNAESSFLVQTNLSVETHRTPAISRIIQDDGYLASLQHKEYRRFLRLLWECRTVGGGGYYRRLASPSAQSAVLPPNSFDDRGQATLWIYVNRAVFDRRVNCAITLDTSKVEDHVQFYHTELKAYSPAFPAGCVGLQTALDAPNEQDPQVQYTREMFSIVGYRIEGNESFQGSNDSLPLLPCENEDPSKWVFEPVLPLYRFAKAEKESPYNAVGKTATVHFEFRDILGNRAETLGWSTTPRRIQRRFGGTARMAALRRVL
ncbi:MAG: hypothetical protein ACLSAP_02830 [Oscillospiraceae bacterium]